MIRTPPAHSLRTRIARRALARSDEHHAFVKGLAAAPSATQRRDLNALVNRAAGLPRGRAVLLLDRDLCATAPVTRSMSGLYEAGRLHRIDSLRTLAQVSTLPAYTADAFDDYVRQLGLDKRNPTVDWSKVFATFSDAFWGGQGEYIDPEHMVTDVITPGLREFVADFRQAGGRVLVLTAMRKSLRRPMEQHFTNNGIENLEFDMRSNAHRGDATAQALDKAERAAKVQGQVLAIFDDLAKNREAMSRVHPEAKLFDVRLPGFVQGPKNATPAGTTVISNFLR